MATGKVEVNNLNLGQGDIPEIERHLLYIGRTDKAELQGKVTRINAMTDLDKVVVDDSLGVNVKAAQLNGKQNWTAAIFGLAADDKWLMLLILPTAPIRLRVSALSIPSPPKLSLTQCSPKPPS